MNAEKIINALLLDLASDQSKAELELERIINDDQRIDNIIIDMKSQLRKLAIIELSITKLAAMTNNEVNKTEENEQD